MKIFTKIASVLGVALLAVGCNATLDEHNEAFNPTPELTEVGFMLPEEATRTSLDPDGKSTRWSVGDKLAVWAKSGDGEFVFESTQFALRYYSEEYAKAYFTSNIAPMAEGEYTYMLSYPMPKSVNGTLATYTLPSTQTGVYDGRYDVMLAEPVVESALTANSAVELNTVMRHKMHALKITVPEGRNLFGQRFYRLEITFPNDVVGDMTIDVSDPTETPIYTNTSNSIVVESATGFDAGDDIWVFVLPGMVDGDVSYKVRGERRNSNVATYQLQRQMNEGHVTPINMSTPTIYPYYTSLMLSIDQNNLGEDFNFFDVYDSNGAHMGKFERNAKNEYFIDYEGEFDADQYDNSTWRVVFDSEHAVVETTINLGDMTDYKEHMCWMNVPYLMFENFSQIPSFSDGHDNPATGWKSDTYNDANLLDSYTSLLAGWSAGRIGASAGQSVRICCRLESGLGAAAYYKGRIDTAPLAKIKSGKSVMLKVSFSYGANRAEYGTGSGNPTLTFGHTTQSGVLAPSSDIETAVLSNLEVSSLNGSYTNTPFNAEFEIDNCTNATRLSWQSNTTRGGSIGGNGNYWIYLDNIKVQIAK